MLDLLFCMRPSRGHGYTVVELVVLQPERLLCAEGRGIGASFWCQACRLGWLTRLERLTLLVLPASLDVFALPWFEVIGSIKLHAGLASTF